MNEILTVNDLSFSYSADTSVPNITDLSFNLKACEIVAILGASGCGKSTFLNLIAGLLKPQAGKIEFSHEQLLSKSTKQQIGYIFQDDALLPWRTVEANLMLVTEIIKDISKETIKERIETYLKVFHFNRDILQKYPSQLSGGMRQRVSIIQTLMFDPSILLLDEPFSALDFFTKLRLENEVYQLIKEQNRAAILITHDIDEAIAIADRVLIMSAGGKITDEFAIDFGKNRHPEEVRGTNEFAQYYHSIWSQLRTVIGT
jgi:NitT/TauT family transport system ATP-binding protein